ncbi:hypothetical protein A7981_10505 [Methylovorus sp. MM2]|uniref:type III pantothenate kinase n=1 Tax=Methylovorus sp. MM2 TaxID=1848038 RepID=UPI0007E1548B|nr:type III pantothenate kinase [Methylovorus sp. MM2]OAM51165.1 hypothetical protein A7981_10505 [Methylovorus sp. MM2]
MILAIDIGNSRLKWATFDLEGQMQSSGAYLNKDIEALFIPAEWRACQHAVVSNVADAKYAEIIQAKLTTSNIALRWAISSKEAVGVLNSYEQPDKLGTDRWAALLAAKQHYGAPCVVVNAGTALTVDALGSDTAVASSIFLGGLILPGLGLMQSSLIQAANGISKVSGTMQDFPVNTDNAIYTGTLSAMVGAVQFMLAKLSQQAHLPVRCIFTGGDAEKLYEAFNALSITPQTYELIVDEALVLQGLFLMEREAL